MQPEQPTKAPRNRHIYLLPNLLTTCGMFAGFYAILAAASGRFEHASVAIFIAAVFDGIDGRVARLTGTSSEFGVQYDSLADLVSFGMAPSLVMYHWALSTMKLDSVLLGKVGWAAAFLYAACAALRLARFNTQVGSVDKRWFIGLSSPAAAGLMMSYVWALADLGADGHRWAPVSVAVTVVAALLMVSRIRYWSFKGGGNDDAHPDRVPFLTLVMMVGVFVLIAIEPPRVLLAIGVTYMVSGPLMALWRRRPQSPKPAA